MIFFIRSVPMTIPPSTGTAPPVYPTPPPRAVTGNRCSFASFNISTICAVDSGNTTASGGNFSLTASAPYGSTFSGSTTTFLSPTISRSRTITSGFEALVVARPFELKWIDWNICSGVYRVRRVGRVRRIRRVGRVGRVYRVDRVRRVRQRTGTQASRLQSRVSGVRRRPSRHIGFRAAQSDTPSVSLRCRHTLLSKNPPPVQTSHNAPDRWSSAGYRKRAGR